MPEDLRRDVLRSQVEPPTTVAEEGDAPWPGHVWKAAREAFNAGWQPPERRYPVVLDPNGPISTAEQLKELLELDETPPVLTVPVAGGVYEIKAEDDPTAKKAQVCDVGEDEWVKLYRRTEFNRDILDFLVWFHGETRSVVWVASVRPRDKWKTGW